MRHIAAEFSIVYDEAVYICDACGEEIVVPVDPSGGACQEYVEDCPVCCHPNVIRIAWDEEGQPSLRTQHE